MASNVMIGCACRELSRFSEYHASIFALDRPEGTHFVQEYHPSIGRGRNDIIRHFLKSDAEYLFFTDDDHVYPTDALSKLMAHNKDVAVGLYLRHSLPFEPVIFDQFNAKGLCRPYYLTRGEHGLVKIVAAGAGCMLIHRSVIEAIAGPYWFELATFEPDMIAEDICFSRKVHDAGFEMWCDLSVLVGHISLMTVWPYSDGPHWQTLLKQGSVGISMESAAPMNAIQWRKSQEQG